MKFHVVPKKRGKIEAKQMRGEVKVNLSDCVSLLLERKTDANCELNQSKALCLSQPLWTKALMNLLAHLLMKLFY